MTYISNKIEAETAPERERTCQLREKRGWGCPLFSRNTSSCITYAKLVCLLTVVTSANAWAATHNVPGDFASIGAAIQAAEPYDTITVGAGRYEEALIIDKPVTLLGAQKDVDPESSGRSGGESTIAGPFPVSITSGDVELNGFEMTDFEQGISVEGRRFKPEDSLQNITISYNWIHSDGSPVRAGLRTEADALQNFLVTHNLFDVHDASPSTAPLAAIELDGRVDRNERLTYRNVQLSFNIIQNRDGDTAEEGGYGVFGGSSAATYLIDSLTIKGNYFRNAPFGANFNIRNVVNGTFANNIVEDAPGALGFDSGVIAGNTFRSGGRLALWGTEFGSTHPTKDVAIKNNEFTDEEIGRALTLNFGVLSTTVSVHHNAFRNSGIQGTLLQNFGVGLLNAQANWWGSSAGPAGNTGTLVGPIATTPWLVDDDEKFAALETPDYWPLSLQETRLPGFWPAVLETDSQ